MIRVVCPNCRKKLGLPERAAGKLVRCPACRDAFRAPTPEPVAAPPSEAVRAAAPRPPAPPQEDVLEEVPPAEDDLEEVTGEDDGVIDAELVKAKADNVQAVPERPKRRKRQRKPATEYRRPYYMHERQEAYSPAVTAMTILGLVVLGTVVVVLGASLLQTLAGIPGGVVVLLLFPGVGLLIVRLIIALVRSIFRR